jgi:lipopolysaccharide export system protein LptA
LGSSYLACNDYFKQTFMKLAYLHPSWQRYINRVLVIPTIALAIASAMPSPLKSKPTSDGRTLTINAQIQEANSKTGVFTARGNVEMFYPARKIQATAAQAQYFSRERRIVLSGNVYVLQEGNSIQGENITYLGNSNLRGACILLGEGTNKLSRYEASYAGIDVDKLLDDSVALLLQLQQQEVASPLLPKINLTIDT